MIAKVRSVLTGAGTILLITTDAAPLPDCNMLFYHYSVHASTFLALFAVSLIAHSELHQCQNQHQCLTSLQVFSSCTEHTMYVCTGAS